MSQAMDSAAGLGIRVARSSAVEGGGSPAYRLWKDVLRQFSIGDQIDFDGLDHADHPGPNRAADGPTDAATRPQREFQFYEGVTDRLRAHAREAPLLIVFEDLHWADDESLRLLAHFVNRLGGTALSFGLITTYRDQPGGRSESLNNAILRIARVSGSEIIHLGPFTEDESAKVVRLIAGIACDGTWHEEIYERTGGNPLFVTEIAQMAVGHKKAEERRELPATVQLAIDDRLGALKSVTVEVLEVASLAQGTFSATQIAAVAEHLTLDQVLDALEEATNFQFLVARSRSTDEWDFRHSVVRDAVGSRISNSRNVKLHADYTDALEIEYRNALPERSEELLFHALPAESLIDSGRLVRYLLYAARTAMRSLAFERAAGHYLRVNELAESEVIDETLAEAMRGIVVAGSGSGQDQEIAQYFRQVFRYYIDAGMIDQALDIAQIRFVDSDGMSEGIEVYEASLELVEPGSRIEANILGRLSRSVGMVQGDYPRAKSLLDRGISIARVLGDSNLEMQLCGDGVNVAAFTGEFAASREFCTRILHLAKETSDPLSEGGAYLHLGIYSLALGETARGFEYLQRSLQRSIDSHVSERVASAHKVLASAYIRICDWESAVRHIRSGLEFYPSDARVLGLKASVEAMTGDADGFQSTLAEFLQTPESRRDAGEGATARYLQMAYRVEQGDLLLSELKRSVGVIESRSQTTRILSGALAFGMACLALEGKRDDFMAIRERLIDQGLPDLELSYLPGIISLAGLVGEAEAEFERMISFAADSGQVFNEAWLRYDYAAHLVRYTRGETVIARALAQGSRVAERAGIVMLAGRYDQPQSTNVSRKSRTAGLTRRELEILQLIHSGMSNPDIAEQLFLSRHTVVRHISNIFAKLEVSNRTEAGKTAVELGLVQGV
ncbi:MAG: hypothetical protein IH867_05070 [Chloroflexi bacterium]|nr:hypothetical protein [Chloroflexota bacterium]